MAIVTATDKITALYVGYFDRAPDPAGLSYWVGRLNAGMSLNDIANSFAQQPETISNYAYLAAPNIGGVPAAQAFINSIYENLFNRAADAPGLAYWTTQLTSGAVSPGLMIEAIIGGAQGTDVTVMNNKIVVGEAYANAFVTANDAWTATDNIASAKAALAGGSVFGATFVQVDATPGSVTTNTAQSTALANALHANPHQAVIGAVPTSINSGSGTDVSLSEAPSQHGAAVTYTITGVNPNEINGPTTGSILLNSQSQGSVHIDTVVLASLLGSANETMTVTADGVSTNVTVAHGSQTVTPSTTLVNEGSTFTVDIGTTLGANAAGLVESYVITGSGLSQIPVADRTGTITLDSSGHYILNVHTLATVFNSNQPNPSVTVTVNGAGASGAATTVTINEVATQSVAASNINEGQTATFTVSTSGVNGGAVAGTVETWTLTGDATVLGQLTGPTSGIVTLDSNGTAAVSVGTSLTVFNIGGSNTETLSYNLFNNGAPVVTKQITVNEATMTVSGNTVNEGTPVTFTVTTNGVVPSGTTFHYHLSGAALGNIAPANQTGSFVISAGGVTNIVLPTLANDPGQIGKSLTFTVDEVASASGNATINETLPFVLTTGTDVFTGVNGANNTFVALATSAIAGGSTIGQNDVLTGGTGGATNLLSLALQGPFPLLVTNFTTNGIEQYNVNANNLAGSTVDLSGAFGLAKLVDANSAGSVLFSNATGPINDLELVNPTDLGVPVNLGLIYQIGAAPGTQNVTLDPTVSPITGLPNSRLTVNVPNFNIASNGAGVNGLVALNAALPGTPVGAQLLGNVTITGSTHFVNGLNGSGVAGMNFNAPGSHSLNLSGFSGAFFNIGSSTSNATAGINNSGGTLTITGGSNSFADFYFPNVATPINQWGGSAAGLGGNATINSSASVNIVINQGSFLGQQVNLTGGNLSVTGGANPTGGFVNNFNTASMTTAGGSVNVQGFSGGLQGTITTNGGALTIGTTSVVTGNIFETISTGAGNATIRLSQGINQLDFENGTGFHTGDSVFTDAGNNPALLGSNLLILNANALGGTASGVQTINFNSGNMTTAGVINMALLNQNTLLVPQQTINVNTTIGATPALAGLVTTDIVNMNSAGTYTLDTGFTTGNATLNLNVVVGSNVTLANTLNGGNTMSTLNFGGIGVGGNTLTLKNDNGLKNLNFVDGNSVTIGTGSSGTGTIINITGGNGNYDLRGLVGVNVSGAYAGGPGFNIQGTNANAAANLLAAAGGIITLGNGSDQVAVGGGSWTINLGNGGDSVVVNPTFTQTDLINTGTGNDIVTVGAVAGGGGIVNINTGAGNDVIQFDNSGANPQLTSASIVQGGTGYDRLQIIGGNVNSFDALFSQIRGIEELDFKVVGVSNFLQLDTNAQADVNSNQTGNLTVVTAGGGSPLSSTFINAGAGFTAPLIFDIGGGGDLGGDNVTTHLGSGALTVNANTLDFMQSFELNANTIQAGVTEGIFANMVGGVQNVLNLTPDNTFAIIDNLGSATSGTHGIQTVTAVFANFNSIGLALPAGALSTDVTTVDFTGANGSSQIWGEKATQDLTLKGGGLFFQGSFNFGTDTLVGGSGNDTITGNRVWINGGGVLTPKDFIWGGLGSDTMTGVAGAGNTGTDFVINSKAELNIQPNAISGDYITNFHGVTDSLFLNPTIFTPGTSLSATTSGLNYVGSGQTYSDVLQLLVGGGTGTGNLTEAVYEIDKHVLWVDVNNDGNLNASDIQIHLDWGSPPAAAGTKIALTVSDFNGLNSSSNLFYDGTNVVPALNLSVANPITIPQWNFFENQGKVIGTTATFFGQGGAIITDPNVANYDFSQLTSGVSVTTPSFLNNGGPPFMVGGGVLGSTYDDQFFVSGNIPGPSDLSAPPFKIDGNVGNDQITIDPTGPLTITITSAMVVNVETLNLVDTLGNTISFGDSGTGIVNINGSTGPDTINTANMVNGGTFNLTNGGNDTVNLAGLVANSGVGTPTTINFGPGTNLVTGAGTINTIINGAGNTTFRATGFTDLSPATLSSISTLSIAAASSIVLTGAEYNMFAAINPDTTTILNFVGPGVTMTTKSTVNAGSRYDFTNVAGGSTWDVNWNVDQATYFDPAASNATVNIHLGNMVYKNTFDISFDGADHFTAVNGTDISQALFAFNGGGDADSLAIAASSTVTMTAFEHNGFMANGGITGFASDTIVLTTDGTVTGASTVGSYVLGHDGGANLFTLGSASQNVTGGADNDTVDVGSFAITGTIALGGGSDVITVHNGADLHGGTISGATVGLNFAGPAGTVSMTAAQEHLFDAAGAMTGTSNNTVDIVSTNGAHVVLGANEESQINVVNINTNGIIVDMSVGNGHHPDAGWTLNNLNLNNTVATTDIINVNNGTSAVVKGTADVTHYDTVSGFNPGPLANTDVMNLTLDGTAQNGGFLYVTLPNTDLGNGTKNNVVDISAAVGSITNPTDIAGATALINLAIGQNHGGADRADTFIISTSLGAAAYEGHVHDNGAHNQVDGLQLVTVLTGITTDQLVAHNFGM